MPSPLALTMLMENIKVVIIYPNFLLLLVLLLVTLLILKLMKMIFTKETLITLFPEMLNKSKPNSINMDQLLLPSLFILIS